MLRMPIKERADMEAKADEFGFLFHSMHGERYWDERAYYQFSLQQIENDIEAPTEEIHQMCLAVVETVIADDELMGRFRIPEILSEGPGLTVIRACIRALVLPTRARGMQSSMKTMPTPPPVFMSPASGSGYGCRKMLTPVSCQGVQINSIACRKN